MLGSGLRPSCRTIKVLTGSSAEMLTDCTDNTDKWWLAALPTMSACVPKHLNTLQCMWLLKQVLKYFPTADTAGQSSLELSSVGPWAGADNFRVGCTPRPTKIFLQILMVQHLYFLFQLVSSFKSCPFGLETACFSSTLHCGIQSANISALRHTSKSNEETT